MRMPQRNIRNTVLVANLAIFLAVANWLITGKEDLLANGRRVLLDVGKFDPLSLIQGRYMRIDYRLAREIENKLSVETPTEGHVVLRIDAADVCQSWQFHDGRALAPDEQLLRFRIRPTFRGRVRIAPTSFLFQDGLQEDYERARFAEMRIDDDGTPLLTALLDGEKRRIGGE